MMRAFTFIASLLLFWTCLDHGTGTASPVGRQENPQQYPAQPRSAAAIDNHLVVANNRFAFRLLAKLADAEGAKNVFVSPASIAMALSMATNGAAGETERAMRAALDLHSLTRDEINAGYASLRALLADPGKGVSLSIANSLWARRGLPFKKDFIDRNDRYYGGRTTELNFDDPQAVGVINSWVNEATKGKIPTIINAIAPQDILFLINAIYFKGIWTVKFDPKQTHDAPFHLVSGAAKPHPFMVQDGDFQYLRGDGFQAVSLPYGDGRFRMEILLPNSDLTLRDFERRLSDTVWNGWMQQFRKREGHLELPRFKLTYDVTLNDCLKVLGMGLAFDPERADFTAMIDTGPQRAFISEVRHKTFVEVNEEGTEAAAATSVGVVLSSYNSDRSPFRMIVDRPFLCAIRDSQTGLLLFMGTINAPM